MKKITFYYKVKRKTADIYDMKMKNHQKRREAKNKSGKDAETKNNNKEGILKGFSGRNQLW